MSRYSQGLERDFKPGAKAGALRDV